MAGAVAKKLISVDYEVFGKVQGVFFRKNTKKTADKYRLVGWVRNTQNGTVDGQIQGPERNITEMKHWLSKVGSKFSKIEKCDFTNQRTISNLEFNRFEIRS